MVRVVRKQYIIIYCIQIYLTCFQSWCYSNYSCFAKIEWLVRSHIYTIIRMRIIHSVLKSPLNSPEIQRIKRREQRDRRQYEKFARTLMRRKTRMRTESRKSTAVLCYVEIEQKRKEKCEWKTVRRKNAKLVSLARPQNESYDERFKLKLLDNDYSSARWLMKVTATSRIAILLKM